MAALPYMQFYVAEYLADTGHLNAAQHGAYILLLMNYWQRGKPLKADDERLATIARMSNKEWEKNKSIIAEFFIVSETEWRHGRVEKDLVSVAEKSDKAKIGGSASATRRAQRTLNERPTNVDQSFNHKEQIRTDKNRTEQNIVVVDDDDDPQVLAKLAARDLHATHPTLCSAHLAEAAAVIEMGKAMGQDPKRIAAAWRRIHAKHVDAWKREKERDPKAYIPHLHVWFRDGMYLQENLPESRASPKRKGDDLRTEMLNLRAQREGMNDPASKNPS